MDMIHTLIEFNRCRQLDDLTQLIASWAEPGEALALYIADTSGRVLTLTAVHGGALDTLESTISLGEHPVWQSIQTEKPQVHGEDLLLPLAADDHPGGLHHSPWGGTVGRGSERAERADRCRISLYQDGPAELDEVDSPWARLGEP